MNEEISGNPDAAQDESLIMEVIKRELLPIFEQIKGEIDHIKQVQEAIVGGFGEAVSNHRRSSLGETIDLSDLGEIGDTYNDLEGSDLKSDLIDHIMESDIPDDQIEDVLNTLKANAREKYGKYKRAAPEQEEPPVPSEGNGELAVQIGVGKPEDLEEESKVSPVESMREKVMALHKSRSGKKF